MKRNFPDFLTAYFDYARDGFCPDIFHHWVGRSVLAAALERKVSLRQGKIHHFPNIYTMLVSHPAVGKSTAMDVGVDLIEMLKKEHNHNFRIIPNQATEPALIDLMKIIDFFPVGDGKIMIPHSSGFFYASEASSSALQNTCGDFIASLTAFYDCPRWFRKKLKGEKDEVAIENGCMNVLAGATFDYLKNLVNEVSVMGGFASRLIYVVAKERKVRHIKWDATHEVDGDFRQRLIEDLVVINKLTGPVTPTKDFIAAFESWQPEFDQFLIGLESPKMESILARKGTNLIKLAIILSVSESNSLTVTAEHFERASAIMDEVTEDNKFVLSTAMIADKTSQAGLNQFIAQIVKKSGGIMALAELRKKLLTNGSSPGMVKETLDMMMISGWLALESGDRIKLLIDPDTNLG